MRGNTDGTHARTAATMRDAEGLVQVDVANIGAEVARTAQPHLGVEVGAVHVDLTAVAVDDFADLAHRRFEDTVGRGVGDHERAEPVGMLGGLGAEVGNIHVSVGVAGNRHNLEARDHGAGRIGAMRRDRNQANLPMRLATGLVVGADDQKPRILSLRASVGLQRGCRKARNLSEPVAELVHHRQVALRLIARREGMNRGPLRPRERHHLHTGIQLHRAGAERDHRGRQRKVLGLQRAHVAEHLVLGVVARKDSKRQQRRAAYQRLGPRCIGLLKGGGNGRTDEGGGDGLHLGKGAPLVECDSHTARKRAEVKACGKRGGHRLRRGVGREQHHHRVEPRTCGNLQAGPLQRCGQHRRQRPYATCNPAKAFGTVVGRIHARHNSKQHLRGADVARRLVATDVLLARLQRQPECRIARAIARLAHEPAGHDPLERLAAGKEARVRTAKAQRNAEALRRTNSDVGTLLTCTAPENRSKRVGGENRRDARSPRGREGRRKVADPPRRRRVLQQ